jgi:hypothetical protein
MFTIAILDAVRVTKNESHAARAEMPVVNEAGRSVRTGMLTAVRRDSSSLLRRFADALEPS